MTLAVPSSDNGGPTYRVEISGLTVQRLKRLFRRAARQGRGDVVVMAFRQIIRRLQRDPGVFGEPGYRLPALRMQIRSAAIRPLVVTYGVCEDRPLVFIKWFKLLAGK